MPGIGLGRIEGTEVAVSDLTGSVPGMKTNRTSPATTSTTTKSAAIAFLRVQKVFGTAAAVATGSTSVEGITASPIIALRATRLPVRANGKPSVSAVEP